MTSIDLDALSIEALQQLKTDIDQTIERKHTGELIALRDQIDALVGESPFTLEEVLSAVKPRKPVAAKYQNPDDASQQWTGRGRRPRWVEAYLEKGGLLEAITI
ncbi:MAG: H-NS family nucleoid-associated regulatory protein [Thiolinea sp.]